MAIATLMVQGRMVLRIQEGAGVCKGPDPPSSGRPSPSCEGNEEVEHRRGKTPAGAPEVQQAACRDAQGGPHLTSGRCPTRTPMKGESWLLEGQTSR